MILRETYLNKIRKYMDKDIIKVLTGVRRCGKSVMLSQIKDEIIKNGVSKEQIVMINFEKLEFSDLLDAKKLDTQIKDIAKQVNKKLYIFLDEIQNVTDWEKAVNSLRVSIDCDIYLTGSNAKLLSSELATLLSGRYIQFEIYPFSFKEFREAYNSIKPTDDSTCFKEYVKLGGMPFLNNLNFDEELANSYLDDVFNTVVLKDIVQRNKVRDTNTLISVIKYCINNMGNSFSASSISKYFKSLNLKVSTETVLNYIGYCLDAYLLLETKKEDVQGKETLGGNSKYYLVDHSLKQMIFSNNKKDINMVLKNIVYLELLRRGYKVTVGYNKTKEVDFVCRKGEEIKYFQVTYLLASDDVIAREFNAYKGIEDNYPKYVLSLDDFDLSRDGIKHINIIDFLLSQILGFSKKV